LNLTPNARSLACKLALVRGAASGKKNPLSARGPITDLVSLYVAALDHYRPPRLVVANKKPYEENNDEADNVEADLHAAPIICIESRHIRPLKGMSSKNAGNNC
jgi:hypothetical protein